MIAVPSGVRIVVATAPVDFRRGMDSLAMLVQQAQGCSPYNGDLFIFRAKRGDRIKILAWDGTGLWLHQKRLEQHCFFWPPVRSGVMTLSSAQLAMLLEGLDWSRVAPVKIKAPMRAC
jgi:transposase